MSAVWGGVGQALKGSAEWILMSAGGLIILAGLYWDEVVEMMMSDQPCPAND